MAEALCSSGSGRPAVLSGHAPWLLFNLLMLVGYEAIGAHEQMEAALEAAISIRVRSL